MNNYDVVIVGGGFAGLSAALVLGRSRRRVLVSDTGKTRNAVAHESHGFFTRDGATPAELVRIGREQLRPYETVELCLVGVKAAKAQSKGFEIKLDDETRIACRKLLLATGVVDEMPEIEGFKELWGKSIFRLYSRICGRFLDGTPSQAVMLALIRPGGGYSQHQLGVWSEI